MNGVLFLSFIYLLFPFFSLSSSYPLCSFVFPHFLSHHLSFIFLSFPHFSFLPSPSSRSSLAFPCFSFFPSFFFSFHIFYLFSFPSFPFCFHTFLSAPHFPSISVFFSLCSSCHLFSFYIHISSCQRALSFIFHRFRYFFSPISLFSFHFHNSLFFLNFLALSTVFSLLLFPETSFYFHIFLSLLLFLFPLAKRKFLSRVGSHEPKVIEQIDFVGESDSRDLAEQVEREIDATPGLGVCESDWA